MSKMRLAYVDHFTDRHGHARFYFRRPGGKRYPLPGLPGSAEFMAAYQAALDGTAPPAPARTARKAQPAPGTFDRLAGDYFSSPEFLSLRESTRVVYRRNIERLIRTEGIGHRLVSQMTRKHVKIIVGKRADTPAEANHALGKLHILMKFAIEAEWRTDDPTLGVKKFKIGEHHTWTDEEIAQFEAYWPIGSRARTIFALLLYTGQRIGDVARMSWRDIGPNGIRVVQSKTGAKLTIPVHPELARALAAWPREHVSIFVTRFGTPFPSAGLQQDMARRIAEAGLPDECVPHGLRKAAARRLAEAGGTSKEIAAVTGHASLQEVERYTRAASQPKLAGSALAKLERGTADEIR